MESEVQYLHSSHIRPGPFRGREQMVWQLCPDPIRSKGHETSQKLASMFVFLSPSFVRDRDPEIAFASCRLSTAKELCLLTVSTPHKLGVDTTTSRHAEETRHIVGRKPIPQASVPRRQTWPRISGGNCPSMMVEDVRPQRVKVEALQTMSGLLSGSCRGGKLT
ncbi:hypothetical protein K438DRAFT_1867358 [Mycena galopus ATCC 62051]|nr:hypothetical protein K438DRAFT_1867358 [Mycena galopus ATCC 62051]